MPIHLEVSNSLLPFELKSSCKFFHISSLFLCEFDTCNSSPISALGKWCSHRLVPFIGRCNSPTLGLSDWSGLVLQDNPASLKNLNSGTKQKASVGRTVQINC